MIFRRLATSIRDQDWGTVTLEIVIVVLGVFIGIQVSNWNDERTAEERERLLLTELRAEALSNAAASESVGDGLLVGAEAARRVLTLHNAGTFDCEPDCWSVVVDLMHASQPQQIYERWTTYIATSCDVESPSISRTPAGCDASGRRGASKSTWTPAPPRTSRYRSTPGSSGPSSRMPS